MVTSVQATLDGRVKPGHDVRLKRDAGTEALVGISLEGSVG